ncbi:hypothetical protein BDW62DRAFT_129195 [Aspergillus aurantiobrunneus]
MPFDHVIQDSDDEEEPLGELSPKKANRAPVTDNGEQQGAKNPPQESNHDSHMGVNFDEFLQSQDAPQRTLSSSQQRREERWIPVTGRVGSMGNMMTEIGLAQQRLFDDDQQAQYAHQPLHELGPVQDVNDETTVHESALGAHDPSIAPAKHSAPHLDPRGTDPIDDWSQSVSYNIFDSSSHTASGQLNRADFIHDSGVTTQTELVQNLELRRWTSMQGAASSPHDTEPFSSVRSPQATRAKSVNLATSIVQPSSASIDELSLPATTELPKVEKRGRKKKQAAPVNDEDDELSHPQSRPPPPIKTEKRKPGRPPKNAKEPPHHRVKTGSIDPPEFLGVLPEVNQETIFANGPEASFDGTAENDVQPWRIVDEPTKDDQSGSPTALAPEHNLQLSPKPAKEQKKKKLKRGKTTSVTLTKTYDSDVEDDVIWIDERPVPTTLEDKTNTNSIEPSRNAPAEQQVPKKPGRKRKKTSDQLDPETAAPPVVDRPDAQMTIPDETNNQPQLSDIHNKSGISVVLDNKTTTRTHTPDIANPITEDQTLFDPPEGLQQPTSAPKPSEHQPPETPQKATDQKTTSTKGPGKHSPISSTSKVPYRVGLSKKARIAPLLKIIKR